MNKDQKGRVALVAVTLQLLLVTPVWFVLVYSVLDKIEAETYQWVLFYIYVPVSFTAHSLIRFITHGINHDN